MACSAGDRALQSLGEPGSRGTPVGVGCSRHHPLVGQTRPSESKQGNASTGVLSTVLVLITWLAFNIAMSTLVKWIYLHGKVCKLDGTGCRVYRFPFMMTAVHMLFSWIICFLLVRCHVGAKPPVLSTTQQTQKIVPLAFCFSVCVAMGNLSLKYIYPSFSQMLSSVAPLITIAVAVIMRGKQYNCWTWVSMPLICGGLLVCSTEEVNFDLYGAMLAVLATILRAVKSVMQEKMLDPWETGLDSVSLLYYMAPYAGVFLVTMSLAFEGLDPLIILYPWSGGVPTTGVVKVVMLLSLSGVNACFQNILGNMVTASLGAVIKQILGNLKASISIVISVAIFKNPVTPMQVGGVALCFFGAWLYRVKGGAAKATTATRQPHAVRTGGHLRGVEIVLPH